ncbi:TniQ family protein [Streptomyces erythrochromogenes]|uniref:TniQ family protein n=1 Tax=Streptomyces erythrochromogenes TaxID=285574 RepID=UPI0033314F75
MDGVWKVPRRLPVVPLPAPGEAFPSWLHRVAADWQIPPGRAAQLLGLECIPGYRVPRPIWFGVSLTQRSLHNLVTATGLDERALGAMQLSRYADTVLELFDRELPDQSREVTSLRRPRREWALTTASRACPSCLATSLVWPVWWRLGIAAVCPKHRVLLVDVCSRCNGRLGSGYTGNPRGLTARQPMLDLSLCNNRRAASQGRKAGPCRQRLSTLSTVAVSVELGALQQRVLDIADGASVRLAGVPVTQAEFFAALRFIAGVVRLVATEEEAASCTALPDTVGAVFTADQPEWRQVRKGGLGNRLQACPPSAAHAASVLALSTPVLFAPDRRMFQDRLTMWMDRAASLGRLAGQGDPLRFLPRPACLEQFLHAAGVLSSRPRIKPAFTADHLPHLVDAGDYAELIARHLPRTAETGGRRLAALALARHAGAESWLHAATALGMNPVTAARATNTLEPRISNVSAFWRDVERLGTRIIERGLIDYAARRRALADLTTVPHDVLLAVCQPRGYSVTMQRRRQGAAWIWQQFTGGNVREAPAYAPALWAPADMASVYSHGRRFAAWLPAPVARALTAYGNSLLADSLPQGGVA